MMVFMTGALAISELDDLRDLAGMAVARVAQSIGEGCARDACIWMRLYERLQRHVARLERAAQSPSAPPSAPPSASMPAPAAEDSSRDAGPGRVSTAAASDSSDSLDRIFFQTVLSSWPSGLAAPHGGRRQTGMAP
jgi:hypothetical protein